MSIVSGVALGLAVVALYKVHSLDKKVEDDKVNGIKTEVVKNFLQLLTLEQLKRLEMSFRFHAQTYQISDILDGDFQLTSEYNAVLTAINEKNLSKYYTVIIKEIQERA